MGQALYLYCLTRLGLTVLLCVAAHELLQNFGLVVSFEQTKQDCDFLFLSKFAQETEQYF